jgi:hypothetical protein
VEKGFTAVVVPRSECNGENQPIRDLKKLLLAYLADETNRLQVRVLPRYLYVLWGTYLGNLRR